MSLFFHFIPFIRTRHTILAGALGNSHTAQRGLPELRRDGTSHGVHDPNGLIDGRNALYARQGKLLIVAPDDTCGVRTLSRDRDALLRLYEKGLRDGQKIPAFLRP